MTIFATESAADCPPELRPSWMAAHHPLSIPDVLVSTKDPAIRAQWVEQAEAERDQTVRLWLLEDRPIGGGPLVYIAHRQTTPAGAWHWYRDMAQTPGHRVVLVDLTAPNRLDNLLEDDGGCDVCSERSPSMAYEVHRRLAGGSDA